MRRAIVGVAALAALFGRDGGALLDAVRSDDRAAVEQLLEAGANPNVADNTGMTSVYAVVDMNTFRSDIGRPPVPGHQSSTGRVFIFEHHTTS